MVYKTLTERMQIFRDLVSVYPVSCERLADGRSDLEWLDAVLAGGTRIVQLRDKVSDDRILYEKAMIFRQRTREAGALLIINNRLDIALLSDADGIHLGNSDIPAPEARRLVPEMIIGVSANTAAQASSAGERGASYYNIGPLFPTSTKGGLSDFLGIDAVSEFPLLSDLPFTVMGGVKFDHIPELVEKGARRLAVVTALSQASDIAAETRRWIEKIQAEIAKHRY